MESPEHERDGIEAYLASRAPDEKVLHLEKVAAERVIGQDHDVWDVHTSTDRWWVITGPTNLYSETQLPSMDVALSFHVGLMARVQDRHRLHAQVDDHVTRFAEAWRKWELAGQALNAADEAEEFQSVGMHCRESLIAFMRTAREEMSVTSDVAPPMAADVKGWADLLGNVIAQGESNREHRGYLKAIAGKTWDLANWLTHYTEATGYHAHVVHQATEHALMNWSLAIMVHGVGGPPRCEVCRSYRLHMDYEQGEGLGVLTVLVCDKCGWRVAVCRQRKPNRVQHRRQPAREGVSR